ncbi:MAG: Ig-like domain-containing protein [archaeon]
MKRCFFLLLVVLFFSSVLATDVAYVVRDVDNVEVNVISGIEALGFSYELIDDSKISSTDFDKYGMILVWDELLSDAELLPVGEKNSLVANSYYLEDWGIADYAGSQVSTGYLSGKILVDNMVTDGFQLLSSVSVYSKTNVVLYHLPYSVKRAPGLVNVVSTDNSNKYPVVGIINGGGKLYLGGTSSERIAFFGITESDYWSSNSMKLFKNTLHWVLTGEDGDGDGFFYDEDCDDSNAGLWQILSGYSDNDGDGFGAGSLMEVCSGNFLPKGYSDVDGDCNDSDALYNLDSDDVFKNCVNDAPIVYPLGKLVVNETDVVVIDLNVSDPEFDFLEYEIDDGRFVENGGMFRWQTENGDEGVYVFWVVVSDGEFEVEVRVEVEVLNQLSVWDEISDVGWDEDSNNFLDLKLYVSNGDGDDLIFFVNSTSEDKNIKIEDIDDGVVKFSVDKNWNGEDWVVFSVYDGSSVVNSGNVTLRVLPVNDAPKFIDNPGKIGDKTWSEGGGLDDEVNLSYYFSDVDFDVLVFDVVGNHFITVEINQSTGMVSFYSDADWFGSENIVFSATDGFDIVYSNAIVLTVIDVNEVPEFGNFSCEGEIDEDVGHECELSADDFEGDDFWFSVVDGKNADCKINGDILLYVSKKDYVGAGSCLIRVSDAYGYSERLIEFEILPVNDAPRIVKYAPVGSLKLMEEVDEIFSVVVSDVDDEDLEIYWALDSENVSTGKSYLFNRQKGVYSLEAVVSDGEFSDSHVWNVFVGDISDFSCEEVGGFVFGEDEICLGDVLGVSDVNCCSIAPTERPPEFSDAKTCSSAKLNLSSGLKIDIVYPDEGDEFEPGEGIEIEIDVDNNFDENLNLDVGVYLYDISDEDSIKNADDSVRVKKADGETLGFVLDVPENIDVDDDYVIFVRVVDRGEVYCNEDFVKIDLERVDDDVVIDSFRIVGDDLICGSYVSVEGKIKNLGMSDWDDVVFVVKNSELGIFEESEEFELEEFGGDDVVKKNFGFRIPDDAVAGDYKLEGSVSYGGGKFSTSVDLVLEECRKLSVSSSVVEPVGLNGIISEAVREENGNSGFVILGGALILLLIILIVILFL